LIFVNNSLVGSLFYVCIVLGFLVKVPMFVVHLCLPKARVEYLVSGSMILAGVLLKLSGYGLLRVFLVLFKFGFNLVSFELHGHEIFKFEFRIYFCHYPSDLLQRELVWL